MNSRDFNALRESAVAAISRQEPPYFFWKRPDREAGVAIVLVVFLVALASILVVNLAYSTYIGARLNLAAQRSLQAEYLLKSALNLASLLIYIDKTPEESPEDVWALYKEGAPIPVEWLGLKEPNLRIMLEIRSEGAKIPLNSSTPDTFWMDTLKTLFADVLQFDSLKETALSGPFKGKEFTSTEMVANLIDYIDRDSESFVKDDYKGLEGDLPKNFFPNRGRLLRAVELANVPGFTPTKVGMLVPTLVSAEDTHTININSAPILVLRALGLSESEAKEVDGFRNDKTNGPFKGEELTAELNNIISDQALVNKIRPKLSTESTLFQIVAKVDYETSSYFLRAVIEKQTGSMPMVKSMELY